MLFWLIPPTVGSLFRVFADLDLRKAPDGQDDDRCKLSWEEKTKGTLEAGKLADMVVLPFDPLTADPEVILQGKVDMTFLAGKLVYSR